MKWYSYWEQWSQYTLCNWWTLMTSLPVRIIVLDCWLRRRDAIALTSQQNLFYGSGKLPPSSWWLWKLFSLLHPPIDNFFMSHLQINLNLPPLVSMGNTNSLNCFWWNLMLPNCFVASYASDTMTLVTPESRLKLFYEIFSDQQIEWSCTRSHEFKPYNPD